MLESSSRSLSAQTQDRLTHQPVGSAYFSFYFCTLILTLFVVATDQFFHWFVIPVFLCGVLIGIDAVDWVRGRLDVLDPKGLLGLLGFHFFFLAPLLHVYWDVWLRYLIIPPAEWRIWLGGMAFLNLFGLLGYRFFLRPRFEGPLPGNPVKFWSLDRHTFLIIVSVALAISGLLQLWVYSSFGGIKGYLQITFNPQRGFNEMQGMGWMFTISESFPILAFLAFAVYGKGKGVIRRWRVLLLVILIFAILQLAFGGLRGSRSNTIWALFWAVGIIHFWLRPIPRKLILLGCVFLLFFLYFYGFMKTVGLRGLRSFEGSEARAELVQETGRSFERMLVGDLGRSDIQAFVLYRLSIPESDYDYAWGRTYLGALAHLIPRSLWPNRPASKVKEATHVLYGRDFYGDGWRASQLYGITGEAMLNFGPLAVPIALTLFGVLISRLRRFLHLLEPDDSRQLICPLLLVLCFVVLVADSDVVLFFLIKNGAIPFLVLFLSSQRI